MDSSKKHATQTHDRRTWERPKVTMVGTIGGVLQGGQGKLSVTSGDPGDSRKQSGTG